MTEPTGIDALIGRLRMIASVAAPERRGIYKDAANALESTAAELRTEKALNLQLGEELRQEREVIEKVLTVPNEFEWDVPPSAKAILATYDQQS